MVTTLLINFSDAQGQITPELVFRSGRNFNSFKLSCMSSLPTRIMMIHIHYKSMGIFPDAQGQLTLQSLFRSGQISNLFEMLWMSSLPARIKKIRSKKKALEGTQDFPHYYPMGAICCHGNQSSDPIWSTTYCSLSPTLMILHLKFDCDRPAGCGDIHV